MSTRWEIDTDQISIAAVPFAEIERAQILAQACTQMEQSGMPTKLFNDKAQEVSKLLAKLPGTTGRPISGKTLERIWYKWKKDKKWEHLVDQRIWGLNNEKRPTAQRHFLLHLATLCEKCSTKKQAAEELLRQWRNAETIPGYEGKNSPKGQPYPKGWSFDNLMRIMPPKRITNAMIQNKGNIPTLEERVKALYEVMNAIYERINLNISK